MIKGAAGELRGVNALALHGDEGDRDSRRGKSLIAELGAGGESQVAAMDDLDVVVGEADSSEGDGRAHDEPDKRIGQI